MDKINEISSKLHADVYKAALYFQKKEELEDLKEIYEEQREKYRLIQDEERAQQENLAQKLKVDRVESVDYIFVTFKHSETKDTALEVFAKEKKWKKCLRYMFCIKSER